MTFATVFLATALFVPSMPPPEYDDCEVVANCVFDASRNDAKFPYESNLTQLRLTALRSYSAVTRTATVVCLGLRRRCP